MLGGTIMLSSLKDEANYLYTTNYSTDEEYLYKLEMKYLFNQVPEKKYFFSNNFVDPSRSPFMKNCISIMFTGASLAEIIDQIVTSKLYRDAYKVSYINTSESSLGFHESRKIEYEIGYVILGEATMNNPICTFGITNIEGLWIFGESSSNNSEWQLHNKKPYSYSNALKVSVSRALVNIAIGNNLSLRLVDPCCGIGTVIIEALSMGINIKGYEINKSIGYNAKKNLIHFGFDDVVNIGDMGEITESFDVAIVDLPYGVFTKTSLEEQMAIISTTRRIASKMIILTFEDMDEKIISAGFEIVDKCSVNNGKFKRYILVCI